MMHRLEIWQLFQWPNSITERHNQRSQIILQNLEKCLKRTGSMYLLIYWLQTVIKSEEPIIWVTCAKMKLRVSSVIRLVSYFIICWVSQHAVTTQLQYEFPL